MKVLVAMSGGIDSSVTVNLLKNEGYEVQGITFKFFEDADTDAAAEVAKFLKIKHLIVTVGDLFQEKVINYAWYEYKNGRTPNPCIFCNRYMKFETLFYYARQFDIKYIATGHYAKVVHLGPRSYIRRGLDLTRDQSYFLFGIQQEHLKKVMFPLGNITKETVKKIGERLGLPNAKRKESRGVCFVKPGEVLSEVLEKKFGTTPSGAILNSDGKQVGTHNGIHRYTVGQRKGLGAFGNKVFVKSINTETNTIVISDDSELFLDRFYFDNLNLLTEHFNNGETEVQIRYGHPSIPVLKIEDDLVILKNKVRAITSGQAAVFYNNNTVIGGGWIR